MSKPLLTVIVPTIGRPTLDRMLRSLRENTKGYLEAYCNPAFLEILVIGDSHKETFRSGLRYAQQVSEKWQATYLEHDGGTHCYGHPQRNYGMKIAKGEWLAWMQDDDVWLPNAMRAIVESLQDATEWVAGNSEELLDIRPRLFRTLTWQAGPVWREKRLYEGNIDADCIITPNIKDRLGEWTCRYCGDFDFIVHTCKLWDMNIRWEEAVIAQGRPR